MKIVNTPGVPTDWKTQETEETKAPAGAATESVAPDDEADAGTPDKGLGDAAPGNEPARMRGSLEGSVRRAMLNSSVFGRDSGNQAAGPSAGVGITQEEPLPDPLGGSDASVALRKQTEDGLRQVYDSPQMKHLDQSERTEVLHTLAGNLPLTGEKISKTLDLLDSVKDLSPADRKLALDGFKAAHANPAYAANLKQLIDDPKFKSLSPAEKTAVLSQTKNYPDPRSVSNIDRMLQKDWFTAQDLGDKQRSLKTVARLSQHSGDRKIIDNTLDKFLGDKADYKLVWKTYPPGDGTTYGEGADKTLWLNKGLIAADNEKMVEDDDTNRLSLNTVAHEVNHLVNGDKVAKTFNYFEAEYRAWYTGFQAQHGRVPTNQEAMDQRIKWQLDPDSFYGKYAKDAMQDPREAQKFFDFLKSVTGEPVDASNWQRVMNSDPASWHNLPTSPAPAPSGNLDNH